MAQPVRRVVLLLEGFGNYWQRHLLRGVQTFAQAAPHWRLHVHGGQAGASRIQSELLPWDGVVSAVIRADSVLRELHARPNVKIVGVSASPRHQLKMPVVRGDDTVVAATIGQHLLAGGFRQFAYFGHAGWRRTDHRATAIEAFAESQGLPFHLFIPTQPRKSDLDLSFPTRQFIRWVAALPKPIGIVVWSMVSAQRVVQACVRAGVAIPQDVAVVACDDDPLIGEISSPTITGMAYSAERIAFRAAELLDDLMNGAPEPAEAILVPPPRVLNVRQSSDAMSLPDRDVYRAVQYIREHARESLKVEQVARAVGASRSRLDEKFLHVLGHTPHEEMVRAHLARAERLLMQTPWTVDRIAAESGFGTRQTMYRVFRERLGKTPADYREHFGVDDIDR